MNDNTALVRLPEKSPARLVEEQFFDQIDKFKELAQDEMFPSRMWNLFVESTCRMPLLLEAKPESLMSALIKAAELKLVINQHNMSWTIPFKSHIKDCKNPKSCRCPVDANFIVGYKGYQQCSMRSNQEIKNFRTVAVYREEIEKGHFSILEAPKQEIYHKPLLYDFDNGDDALEIVYTIIEFKDGSQLCHWTRRRDILKAREATKAKYFDRQRNAWVYTGPWGNYFRQMAEKTDVRRLHVSRLPFLPLTPIAKAIDYDDEREGHLITRSFDKPQLPAPKPSRVEKIVTQQKAKKPTPIEHEVGPVSPSEAEKSEAEEKTADENVNDVKAVESKAVESHDASASPAPETAQNGDNGKTDDPAKQEKPISEKIESQLDEWREKAIEVNPKIGKKQFDGTLAAVLRSKRVNRLEQLPVDQQQAVVKHMATIVQEWERK